MPPESGRYERRLSEPALLAPTGTNRCKGLVFDSTLELLGTKYGAAAVNAVKARLPEPLRSSVTAGAMVKGGWYPLDWYDALHVAAQEVTGRGADLAREIGRESTRHDLSKGVYRVFLKIVWPDLVLQKAPLIFNRYFEEGEMAVEPVEAQPFQVDGRKTVSATFRGCTGFTESIWQDVFGGCEGALLAAGARDVTVTLSAGGRGQISSCAARASYR